jgi:hypothetical protein
MSGYLEGGARRWFNRWPAGNGQHHDQLHGTVRPDLHDRLLLGVQNGDLMRDPEMCFEVWLADGAQLNSFYSATTTPA